MTRSSFPTLQTSSTAAGSLSSLGTCMKRSRSQHCREAVLLQAPSDAWHLDDKLKFFDAAEEQFAEGPLSSLGICMKRSRPQHCREAVLLQAPSDAWHLYDKLKMSIIQRSKSVRHCCAKKGGPQQRPLLLTWAEISVKTTRSGHRWAEVS